MGLDHGPIQEKLVPLVAGTRLVIQDARLIDGTGQPPRERVSIVVHGDRIEQVLPPGAPLPQGPDVTLLDASGKTVIPGLIDVHVHLTGVATMDPYRRYLWPSEGVRTIRAALDAYKAYEAGWTTMVDLGWPSPAKDLKLAINSGLIEGPRILTAIAALSQTGGHGDWHLFPYRWMKEVEWRGRIVDGADECRKAVRLNFREGADLTKIMLTSGGFGSEHDWPPVAAFGDDELRAIVDETHSHHGTVAAHCIGSVGVRKALAAGVNTIEHGVLEPSDFDLLGQMAEREITLVPTLSVFTWFNREGLRLGMPKWGVDMAGWVRDTQFEMVRRALAEGVRIAAGTDTGSSFGIGLNAFELELLVEAGLSPMQAIVAATRNAAEARGIGDQVGTIEPGKLADLLILDVDPLENIKRLQDKQHVVKILRSPEPIS